MCVHTVKIGESENNSTYTVSYLFEHDVARYIVFTIKEITFTSLREEM